MSNQPGVLQSNALCCLDLDPWHWWRSPEKGVDKPNCLFQHYFARDQVQSNAQWICSLRDQAGPCRGEERCGVGFTTITAVGEEGLTVLGGGGGRLQIKEVEGAWRAEQSVGFVLGHSLVCVALPWETVMGGSARLDYFKEQPGYDVYAL